ncbi:DUF5980 family protein [Streptomyces sp. NEAU-174]|uniref:DUF5980 family protein n=1 Tax=Streptomyces sp. NEAU-174 TaxID=3458254 RepID=UPI004044BE79
MRAFRCLATAAVGLALAVAGAPPASAATWKLEPIEQRICVDPDHGNPGAYFVGSVSGHWSRTITTGLRSLPPGSVALGSTTLPPGSHENPPGSKVINVFSGVRIGPAPKGEYVSELWATDGEETQAMPVRIGFQDGC